MTYSIYQMGSCACASSSDPAREMVGNGGMERVDGWSDGRCGVNLTNVRLMSAGALSGMAEFGYFMLGLDGYRGDIRQEG
jgi:hypothetical protein